MASHQVSSAGSVSGVSSDSARRSPPAFLVSAGFGLVGFLALLLGLVIGVEAMYLIGVAAGVISLIAALVWREELILAWNTQRKKRERPQS